MYMCNSINQLMKTQKMHLDKYKYENRKYIIYIYSVNFATGS